MPAQKITDAWVRNLSWTKALNGHLRAKAERRDKPLPKQIRYLDTMDRGLALVLILSSGGTKTFR
ncbi:MAG: hypothetical protein ACREDL_05840, partial [Bradyrhizobium sp.]